jgi:hypothetical protein
MSKSRMGANDFETELMTVSSSNYKSSPKSPVLESELPMVESWVESQVPTDEVLSTRSWVVVQVLKIKSHWQALHGQSDFWIGIQHLLRCVRTFIVLALSGAEESYCEGSCQRSEFVFIQDMPSPPTVNQSCQCGAIRSPSYYYKIGEAHNEVVRSFIWPLHAPGGSAIHSLHPKTPTTFSNQARFGFYSK